MTNNNDPTISLLAVSDSTGPYSAYNHLRERDPVHWCEPLKAWMITRYEDVTLLSRDSRLSSGATRISKGIDIFPEETRRAARPFLEFLTKCMICLDEPDHVRLRMLLDASFTRANVAKLQPFIKDQVQHLLRAGKSAREFDVIQDFAYPLQSIVISKLLGIPSGDRQRVACQTDDLGEFFGAIPPSLDQLTRAVQSCNELRTFFLEQIRAHRQTPQDDLIQFLIECKIDEECLTDEEIAAQCVMLLFGANETTRHLIGNGVHLLLKHRGELEQLMSDMSLLAGAVEEILRYESPAQFMSRMAIEGIEIRGQNIQPNDPILLMIGSANRDPQHFGDAEEFKIRRSPNRHLAFGSGKHYCIGATLARMQAAEAISGILWEFPRMEPAYDKPQWLPNLIFRGFESLQIHPNP